jgi:hypothetical protein
MRTIAGRLLSGFIRELPAEGMRLCRFCGLPFDHVVEAATRETAMRRFDHKNQVLDSRQAESPCSSTAYDEEAIPERDPAYRLPHGTSFDERTVEAISQEVRLHLARQLQELGMQRSRALYVSRL